MMLTVTTFNWCRNSRVKTIMRKRFDYAKKIGCDGIEPDNTGAYQVAMGGGSVLHLADASRSRSAGARKHMCALRLMCCRFNQTVNHACLSPQEDTGFPIKKAQSVRTALKIFVAPEFSHSPCFRFDVERHHLC